MQIFYRYSAHMEENANKLHFYRLYLCYSSTNFDCIFIASTFVIHLQILIFPVFKIASFQHTVITDCKSNFSHHCSFTYLLLRSIHDTGNSLQQTSLQCLSTINMVFSDENKILIKHINTLRIHSYTHRGIKIGAFKCNLFVFFFHMC